MSVWYTESFKGTIYQAVSRLPGITYSIWSEFVQKASVEFAGGSCDGVRPVTQDDDPEFVACRYNFPAGHARDMLDLNHPTHDEFHEIFWEFTRRGRNSTGRIEGAYMIRYLLNKYQDAELRVGLQAVYDATMGDDKLVSSTDTGQSRWVQEFVDEAAIALCGPARLSESEMKQMMKGVDQQQAKMYVDAACDCEAVLRVVHGGGSKTVRKHMRSIAFEVRSKLGPLDADKPSDDEDSLRDMRAVRGSVRRKTRRWKAAKKRDEMELGLADPSGRYFGRVFPRAAGVGTEELGVLDTARGCPTLLQLW